MTSGRRARNRAAVTTAEGGLSLETVPVEAPRRHEALVETRLSGICGTDLYKIDQRHAATGAVLGHEIVADVIEVGAECALEIGQRVVAVHHVACGRCRLCRRGSETQCATFRENLLAPGGFSELIVLDERACESGAWVLPDDVSDAAAIFLEPAACVLRSIERGLPADAGQSVAVVMGAGSMGQLHGLVLRVARPDARVLLVEPRPERRSRATRLGLEALAPETLRQRLEQLDAGDGADVVYDTAGGHTALGHALEALRPGGCCVLFAHSSDPDTDTAETGDNRDDSVYRDHSDHRDHRGTFDLNAVFKTEKTVVGSYSSGRAEQSQIFRWLRDGALDPAALVTHVVPAEEIEHALDLCRRGEGLKVALMFQLADIAPERSP